jgi:hypothetical protein
MCHDCERMAAGPIRSHEQSFQSVRVGCGHRNTQRLQQKLGIRGRLVKSARRSGPSLEKKDSQEEKAGFLVHAEDKCKQDAISLGGFSFGAAASPARKACGSEMGLYLSVLKISLIVAFSSQSIQFSLP